MKLLKPTSELCQTESQTFKDSFQEYLCTINQIQRFYDKQTFEQRCKDFSLKTVCQDFRACHEFSLERFHMGTATIGDNETWLAFTWTNPRIIYVEDFISYDFHNFIGEVGGYFGLFLGFSFTSLFDVLEWIQRRMN